jgi:phage protein D
LVVLVMPVVMPEHVHQRARKQEQERQRDEEMTGVRQEQVGAKSGERECYGPPKLTAEERVALAGCHSRISCPLSRRIDK